VFHLFVFHTVLYAQPVTHKYAIVGTYTHTRRALLRTTSSSTELGTAGTRDALQTKKEARHESEEATAERARCMCTRVMCAATTHTAYADTIADTHRRPGTNVHIQTHSGKGRVGCGKKQQHKLMPMHQNNNLKTCWMPKLCV